jgi:RNA polymerase sigma-70 factor (ECF subfamily)
LKENAKNVIRDSRFVNLAQRAEFGTQFCTVCVSWLEPPAAFTHHESRTTFFLHFFHQIASSRACYLTDIMERVIAIEPAGRPAAARADDDAGAPGVEWTLLRAGDDRAWEAVYEYYADPLYRALRSWLPYLALEELEELLAETFARCFAAREQIGGCRQLEGWLFKVARNLSVDRMRKLGRSPQLLRLDVLDAAGRDEVLAVASGRDCEIRTENSELSELVNQVLAELPVRQQQALIEKYRNGASLKELGKKLGLKIDGAAALLYRARAAFRERFAHRTLQELKHEHRT